MHINLKNNIIQKCKIFTIFLFLGGKKVKDKITILIADDNPDFANTVSGYIEEDEDFEIIAIARDGRQAVEMILNRLFSF